MSVSKIDYNSIAAFERSKQPPKRSRNISRFATALIIIFFVVLMIGLATGVTMHQAVTNNQSQTNAARVQASLLANSVHANDTANALRTGNGPEGRALVFAKDGDNGRSYEVRLYLYEGSIVQEYSIAGAAYTPERAQPLLASSTFEFDLHDDLLVIRTDQGSTNVALRSYQGGDA